MGSRIQGGVRRLRRVFQRSRVGSLQRMAPTIRLHDFRYHDPRGNVQVTVRGRSLKAVLRQVANCHGVPLSKLLANCSISNGKTLQCCLVTKKRDGDPWFFDKSGYITLRLKGERVFEGFSYSCDRGGDSTYRPSKRISRQVRDQPRKTRSTSALPPKRRPQRSSLLGEEWDCSDSSGADDSVGRNEPLLLRLHHAVSLASGPDPSAFMGQLTQHICGNKKCATAAHFRIGTGSSNKLDEIFHKSNPSCSRLDWPKVQ